MTLSRSLDQALHAPVAEAIGEYFPSAMALLGKLVRIPGIAWPSFDPAELDRSAAAVAAELEALEIFDTVAIKKALKTDGNAGAPAILARRAGSKDALHVLLYAHHDVQPPGDLEDWLTPPFEATIVGERVFGRGAADDKAGILTHIFALKALKELSEDLRLGITVFIEGEEEAGSPSFKQFLTDNRDALAADLIIVADSGNWNLETPSLTRSLRGMVGQTFTVSTLDHAVHSGMFGGPAPDAMTAMVRLLASLHDEAGNVAISGLKSLPISGPEYSESQFRADAGLLPETKLIGSKGILQQNWGEPALTVIGIDYPSVAVSSNTMHPSVTAKVSLRIAPGEDPEMALEALKVHLTENAPFGSEISFGEHESGQSYLAKSGWAALAANRALELAWGAKPVEIGIGGSIPFISELAHLFPAAEILVTGVEDPDSRAHSPNESQHIPTLRRAMEAEAMLLIHGNSLNRD